MISQFPLAKLFTDKKIRVIRAVEGPLFFAADIGVYIGDDNYNRKIREYNNIYIKIADFVDSLGRRQKNIVFLTELGVYKYLFQSKRPEAEILLDQIYGIKTQSAEKQKNKGGYVYFVQGLENHIKIGYTKQNISARIQTLQTGNAQKLRLITCIYCDNPVEEESLAHLHFSDKRVLGEWFSISEDEVHTYVVQKLANESSI